MTKIIAVSGGIGSGKTTIAKHFASLGIPVYIADDEAKKLMDNPEIINELKSVFVNSFPVNNDLQNGASNNVFNYMKDKFKFTDKTYNDTFERAVEGNNIEVANRLVLEENIKPKITVLNKIKEEMPELYKICENKILNEKTNKEVIIKRQKNDIDFKM